MKILSLGAAGSTHIRNRVRAFLRSGHDNTFLADDHFHDVEIPNVIYLKKWSSESKFLRPFIFLKNIFSLLSVLRSGNYDILHAYNPSNYLCWIASIISNKPIVVITMGGDVLFEQHKCLFWYQKILVKLTLENSSLAIAKSPYIKKRVQQLCDTNVKVFSCIFGVSGDFLLKKNTNKKETKELIFLSLRPIKSFYKIDKIIDVIHHIKKMQINVKLKIFTLAPDLYYLSFLKEKVNKLKLKPNISFVPSTDKPEDLIEEYSRAHFTIALPPSDGIPQSALEGMALGCVPILPKSDIYSNIFDNSNSLLVSGSANKISEHILKSIRKPNRVKDIAETGKYFVQQYGSLESNIRKINENVKNIENRNNFFLRAKILCLAIIYFFDQFFLMGLRKRVL